MQEMSSNISDLFFLAVEFKGFAYKYNPGIFGTTLAFSFSTFFLKQVSNLFRLYRKWAGCDCLCFTNRVWPCFDFSVKTRSDSRNMDTRVHVLTDRVCPCFDGSSGKTRTDTASQNTDIKENV